MGFYTSASSSGSSSVSWHHHHHPSSPSPSSRRSSTSVVMNKPNSKSNGKSHSHGSSSSSSNTTTTTNKPSKILQHLTFVFVMMGCLGNFLWLSQYEHKRDTLFSIDKLTQLNHHHDGSRSVIMKSAMVTTPQEYLDRPYNNGHVVNKKKSSTKSTSRELQEKKKPEQPSSSSATSAKTTTTSTVTNISTNISTATTTSTTTTRIVPKHTSSIVLDVAAAKQEAAQAAHLLPDELSWGATRIPGYMNYGNDTTLVFYGHVMRELSQRICARQIAQSNIVVISPQAPKVVDMLLKRDQNHGPIQTNKQEYDLRRRVHHQVGPCTLIHAHRQGHAIHGFQSDNALSLDEQWMSKAPGWILFMMFDGQWDNDDIVANSRQLLKQSTVTYIVLGIGASPQNGVVYGKEAIRHLLRLKYKVQILSQSHKPSQNSRTQLLAPNSDVTTNNLRMIFGSMTSTAMKSGRPVHGYVFCTQGLDLAIPTAMAYEPTIGSYGVQYKQCPATELQIEFYSSVVYTAAANQDDQSARKRRRELASKAPIKYKVSCQGQRIKLNTNDTKTILWMSGTTPEESEAICVRTNCGDGPRKSACTTRIVPPKHLPLPPPPSSKTKKQKKKPNLLLLMLDPLSRARFERSLLKTNRLIQMLNFTSFTQYTAVGNNSGPNQAALYSGQPLASRESISTHGSEATTRWLWDTLREQGGYVTFKAEDGCVENSNMIQSIQPKVHHGDALLEMMCFDFQRPNCIGETPAAVHLIQYAKRFIETYEDDDDGEHPWAALLHFIDSHEDTQMLEGTLDDPISRFLFDFYHLKQCSDDEEEHCESIFDNTMILLLSDHGLHYGSYILSPQGLKERSQPVLHMHLPKQLLQQRPNVKEAMKTNRHLHTTPFDVYQTILDVLMIPPTSSEAKAEAATTTIGSSLLEPLPSDQRKQCTTTDGVPSFVCDILKGDDAQLNAMMPSPPSPMSFYSDIPPTNKVTRPICDAQPNNSTIFKSGIPCFCSTSHRPKWYHCTQHPWARGPDPVTLRETFAMVDCVEERSYEIHVQRDPQILKRPEIASKQNAAKDNDDGGGTAQQQQQKQQKPNILFIEVDSVSTAYADRHLPKTRELLNRLRLQKKKKTSDSSSGGTGDASSLFTCPGSDERLCSVEMEKTSVVGASSIPNQVAVFGGCIVSIGPEQCTELLTDDKNRTICNNATHPVYGMGLVSRLRTSATFCPVDSAGRSPWIFDIAKSAGYVTLFAEEFCYEGSIYVPQQNVFPLNVDIEPGKFYCQAARLKARDEEIKLDGRPLWYVQYKPLSGQPNCVHQDGGYDATMVPLDHVTTMWDSYPDIPKLAYVNAISAHTYAPFDKMAEKTETYDLVLSSFLEKMMARDDAASTIIVVRSDHGLQGGPTTPDYSVQIEAFRPWTEIIVPKNLKGISLTKLFKNQQRLVTGFDFYKTLTATIVGEEDKDVMPKPPSWTKHLWQEDVSTTRTCEDARASNDYCLFEGQRTFTSPNIRSCNLVEEDQQLVCPLMAHEFAESMSEIVVNSFYTTTQLQQKICPRNEASEPPPKESLTSLWDELRKAANERPEATPEQTSSWLPNRQANILTSIVSDLSDAIHKAENRSLHVCQTGFGQGHSAALFLDAHPNVFLNTFARLNHTTQTPMLFKLQSLNGNAKRLKHHKCDSCLAMLEYERKNGVECDFLHAFHPTSKGYADPVIDLVRKAPCGIILTTIATKSLRDPRRLYFGRDGQWSKLRERECIEDIHCFTDSKPGHKFCMAVTTGKCQHPHPESSSQSVCTSKIAAATRRIVLSQMCPAHEVTVPPPTMQIQAIETAEKLATTVTTGTAHKLTRLQKKTKEVKRRQRKTRKVRG